MSVFGVGADLSENAWRGVLRQLLANSLLAVDHEGYGTLALTETSRAVLKGEHTLMLRRESEKKSRSSRSAGGRGKEPVALLPPEAQQRFELLRAWRADVARNHGVPAYVVFHDATLREVALESPQTLEDLAGITGIGVRKREVYGEELLRCVAGLPVL